MVCTSLHGQPERRHRDHHHFTIVSTITSMVTKATIA
jgi:hypothetical protein